MNKHKHLAKRYVSLMERASNSIGRKEAISLLHKAEKIRLKMASTEELEVFYHLDDSDPYFASYRKIKKKNEKCLKVNIYLLTWIISSSPHRELIVDQ